MSDSMAPLDGNAAAGTLSQIFACDVTNLLVKCAGCGAVSPLAELNLYGAAMGVVLRCRRCGKVNLRATEVAGTLRFDVRGSSCLTLSLR